MRSFLNCRPKARSELMNFVSQLRSLEQTVHLHAAICGCETAAAERTAIRERKVVLILRKAARFRLGGEALFTEAAFNVLSAESR